MYQSRQKYAATSLETETDSGPGKKRALFTAGNRPTTSQMNLSSELQRSTFDDFFHNTTAGGVLRFDYTDPIDGTTQEFRFIGEPDIVRTGQSSWRVSMQTRRMP